MSQKARHLVYGTSEAPSLPRLESGDRLSRQEFERRYESLPELKKAELIEGVVYVPSPTRLKRHGKPQRHMATWMGVYEAGTRGVEGADNATVRLDLVNEPQPDLFLRIEPERGGQSRTSADDYVEGAPELIAEVSSSSVSYDLHAKLEAYRRNGVLEYVVWRVDDRAIDWFVLRGGKYRRLRSDRSGILKSGVFPGLWLDAAALLRRDLKRVLAVLEEGLRTPQHERFVQRLARARTAVAVKNAPRRGLGHRGGRR
ncbi:MAG: Uma2 family endonuclease [Planctomycetes bacterium]|nr:Uma2 family endonuclease [Planctomycetota bacterium]